MPEALPQKQQNEIFRQGLALGRREAGKAGSGTVSRRKIKTGKSQQYRRIDKCHEETIVASSA
jgi:hypothetical protein